MLPARSAGPFATAFACIVAAAEARAGDQPQWGQRGTRNMVSDETGLPETGAPSLALLAAVAAEDVAVAPVVEEPAAPAAPAGAAVPTGEPIGIAEMQELLNARGYGPLSVDGKMGPATREALKRFSAEAGFGADAGMTPAVLNALAGRQG